ncbi:50S ribosomal protein L22 [Candidatus Peregrinibacteria bacterium]|nr:50S ribosomal protein L22 [Candidatus Peregrinibacteria bacterium]
MKAIARTIRITPKKANLVAGMVRKRGVNEALEILKFTPKKAAQIIYKVVASAASNAETNFKQDKNNLVIKEIVIGKGPTLKRRVPVSRGRAFPIDKRTSNITVLLSIEEPKEIKKQASASTEKTQEKDMKKDENEENEENASNKTTNNK